MLRAARLSNRATTMNRRFLAGAALLSCLTLSPLAHAERSRAVRVPAASCTFELNVQFGNPVPYTGMVDGLVLVSATPASCISSWVAYSDADWMVVTERSSGEAAVTVKPNDSTLVRSATVRVAGLDYRITQVGKPDVPIFDGGLVKNGSFDTNLANWGWQDRFPNGVGTVTWVSTDANGNAGSGSMRVRNTSKDGPGMQILQCVPVTGGALHELKYAFSMSASGGLMQSEIIDFPTSDCSGPYGATNIRYGPKQYEANGSVAWRRESAIFRAGFDAQSAIIVFASKTTSLTQPFDLFVDDVVIKQQ
jgi:hypothetical protein